METSFKEMKSAFLSLQNLLNQVFTTQMKSVTTLPPPPRPARSPISPISPSTFLTQSSLSCSAFSSTMPSSSPSLNPPALLYPMPASSSSPHTLMFAPPVPQFPFSFGPNAVASPTVLPSPPSVNVASFSSAVSTTSASFDSEMNGHEFEQDQAPTS